MTDQICIDSIDSRNETKKIVQDFDNCPVEENGRKIGAVDSAAQNLETSICIFGENLYMMNFRKKFTGIQ